MDSPAPETKSDRTRAAIVRAAKAHFAASGYERATIRDIAATAKIDPALVLRYFGSKDELFALVTDFDLKAPDLSTVDRARIGEVLVSHFLTIWEGESTQGLPILLRSATSNERAAARVREIFARQVLPAIARLTGEKDAAERAGLVASQLLGLGLCRYVLRMPPVVAIPRARLVSEVGRTIQRYITGEGA